MTTTMRRLTNLLILLLLAAVVLPDTADAQLLKRLKDRAKERIEKNVENKANDAVDKAVDDAVDKAADGVEDAAMSAFERKTQPKELNLGENASGPADAPHVQYRSVTSMDLGALGRMARLFGKELEHQTETVSISGLRQRTDSENQSTIIDLEEGRMIMLDHEKRQYSVFSFSEMAERMDEALAEMKAEAERQDASAADQGDADDQPDVETDVKLDMSVDRTGRTETINGSPSEQLLVKMRADFDVKGTDESGEEASFRGTTYALVDTWMAKDIAGLQTIQNFQREMGERMGETLAESDAGESLAAMGVSSQIGTVMEEAGKEMQALDGFVVRSTMHLILVPEGQELDVEKALSPSNGDQADSAAALAQMNASSDTDAEPPAEQVTLLRTVTQVGDLAVTPLPDDHFDVPSDYTEVDPFAN